MRASNGFGLLLFGGLLCGLGGCQSLPQPPKNGRESLVQAQAYLQEKRYELCLATLDYLGMENLSLDDKSLWCLLGATAQFELGDPWGAYERMREFAIKHQFRRHSQELADLMFKIGETLARSDRGFGFLWSDRASGRTVLKELVSYYPVNKHVPDAHYRLGEMAFEDGDYEAARLRFSKIVFDSVWSTKAAFRFAMCYYRRLEGPDYDHAEMRKAEAELRGFLDSKVENPQYRAEARAALADTRAMLAAKHLGIAKFYFEVGSERGGIQHLRKAASEFPETAAGKTASARLQRLESRSEGNR